MDNKITENGTNNNDLIVEEDIMTKTDRLGTEIVDFLTGNSVDTLYQKIATLKNAISKVYKADKEFNDRFLFLEKPLCWLYIVKNTYKNNEVVYAFEFDSLTEPLVYEKFTEIQKLRNEALRNGIVIQKPDLDTAINKVFESQTEYDRHVVTLKDSPLRTHKAAFRVYTRIMQMLNIENNELVANNNEEYKPEKHVGMKWKTRAKENVICITEDVFAALINCCPEDGSRDEELIDSVLENVNQVINGDAIGDSHYTFDDVQKAKLVLRDCCCLHMNNGVHLKTVVTYAKNIIEANESKENTNDNESQAVDTGKKIIWGKQEFLVFKKNDNI